MNNEPRQLSLSTYFSILPQYPVIFRLAIIFLALPLFILLPAVYFLSSINNSLDQHYDYTTIDKNGIPTKAVITGITTVYHTKINNQHPKLIRYTYSKNGRSFDSEEETLDQQAVQQLQTGDSINIKVWNNESAISNIKPFRFPFYVFYFIPLPFLLAGIILTVILLSRANKQFLLYKYGDIKEATITSVMRRPMTGRNNVGRNLLIVDYDYAGITGNKLKGKSTAYFSDVLMNKKSGDPIEIFVSEKDESTSCLVPDRMT